MHRILIILIILFPLSTDIIAQKLIYRVDWKGDSIGYLIAERSRSGSLITYELKSRTKFSFMLSFDMYTEYYTVFKDGKLLSATSENTVNDKRKSLTTVKLLEEMYHIKVDDEARKAALHIPESIATLYFTPPMNEAVFSERYGDFCQIRKEKNGVYALVKPDERENLYFYENGICTRVELNLALATIQLKKIN